MKIIIFGSSGGLGSDCRAVLARENEVVCPDREAVDIVSWDGVIDVFDSLTPEVVVNCVGFTDLKACETDAFTLRKINVEGPRNLAQSAARFGCKIVHISCGYVFDGKKPMPQPYFEDDAPIPLSAYGKSKLESETAIRGNSPNYIIVRSNWLYGINGANPVKSVVAHAVQNVDGPLKLAEDQFGAPTWTYRLAVQIKELLMQDGRGSYHATAEGYCSPAELGKFVLDKLGLKAKIEACSLEDLPLGEKLPANSVLENRLSKKQGANVMQPWKKDLSLFLDKFGDQLIEEARK